MNCMQFRLPQIVYLCAYQLKPADIWLKPSFYISFYPSVKTDGNELVYRA